MRILKAYKAELDPNNKQRTYFRRCAGTARFVYNWALADRIMRYEKGLSTSQYEQRTRFNSIKDEQCPWIREVPYAITESAFANCDMAYQNFFRRVKNSEKPGFPKFKRRGMRESFQLRDTKVVEDKIRFTRPIGWIRLKEYGYIPVDANYYGTYATISEQGGHWFVSVLVEEEIEQPQLNGKVIGVDFGINHLAICSDGMVFENSRPLDQATRKLKRIQRELSRREKGGSNWHKTKDRLRRVHYSVANQRQHIQHQISHYLTFKAQPAVIVLEDLNVSGMLQNHHIARALSDVGFYELRRQIEYKAEWLGIEVIYADRFFPSSKTCSRCGSKRDDLKLSERTFVCNDCGFSIDRDLNAALNLAALVNRETHGNCLGS